MSAGAAPHTDDGTLPQVPHRPLQRLSCRLILAEPWAWPLEVGEALRGALGWSLESVSPAAYGTLFSDPPRSQWSLRLACTGHAAPVLAADLHLFSADRGLGAAVQRALSDIRELALRSEGVPRRVAAAECAPLPPLEHLDELAEDLGGRTDRWMALTPAVLSRGHLPLRAMQADLGDLLAAAIRSVCGGPATPGAAPRVGRDRPLACADASFRYKLRQLPALVWSTGAQDLPDPATRRLLAAAWATGIGRCVRAGAGGVLAVAR